MKAFASSHKLRRTTSSNFGIRTNKDKFQAYLIHPQDSAKKYGQDLEHFLLSFEIPTFFHNLHHHLKQDITEYYKKNTILDDGVYILVEGCLTYVWVQHRYDRDGRQNFFSLAKNGQYSLLSQNPYELCGHLQNGYSIPISQEFTVIECENGNIMTNQDSYLVKIEQVILELTHFYPKKAQRQFLLTESRLRNSFQPLSQKLFQINTQLYHTLKNRIVYFHNQIKVSVLGIVADGVLSMRSDTHKKIQLTKNSILLPQIVYQIESSSATILQIQNNPTLKFNFPQQTQKYIEKNKTKSKIYFRHVSFLEERKMDNKEKSNSSMLDLNFYRSQIEKSVSDLKKSSTHSQIQKRKRQVNYLSKQCENFCVISMQYCKQNLNYAQNRNKFNIPKQQKLKNPNVLFYSPKKQAKKQQKSHSSPFSLQNIHKIPTKKQIPVFKHKNSDIFQRYAKYSKQLYQKYQSEKQKNKKRKSIIKKNFRSTQVI